MSGFTMFYGFQVMIYGIGCDGFVERSVSQISRRRYALLPAGLLSACSTECGRLGTVVEAAEQDLAKGPTTASYEMLPFVSENTSVILACTLSQLQSSSLYPLQVQTPEKLIPCVRAWAIVRPTTRSRMQHLGTNGLYVCTEGIEDATQPGRLDRERSLVVSKRKVLYWCVPCFCQTSNTPHAASALSNFEFRAFSYCRHFDPFFPQARGRSLSFIHPKPYKPYLEDHGT